MTSKFKAALLQGGSVATLAMTLSAGAMGFANPAVAAEVEGPKVTWLVSLWGARRGFTEGIEGFAQYLSDKTDGNFELSLQYGGVLSEPKENLDGLQIGAFEAALFCPTYHPDKTPVLSGLDLAYLPLGTYEVQEATYEAYFKHPAVVKELAQWNTVPIMSALLSNYEIMGRGDAPMALADWKGKRVNASGGLAAVTEALGAVPVAITGPDSYETLERGVVDAVAFPYTYAFVSYRVHEISDWVTDHWSLGTIQCSFGANMDAYNALPDQYKALIEEAKLAGYDHQIAEYTKIDEANEATFAELGLERIPMTEDVQAALNAAIAPSWQAWVDERTAEGYPGQELLDLILSSAAAAKGE